MKLLKTSVLAALLLASAAANADTYNFSYSFSNTGDNNPLTLTGYLSGLLNGSYLENVSDVHVFLNGTEFSGGSLYAAAWNSTTHAWDNTIAPIISTDASKNNFIFADANVPTDFGVSNYFYFTNDPAMTGSEQEVFAVNMNKTDANGNALIGDDVPANGTWTLTAAPVPEPETFAMLLAGLGLVGFGARRRQA